MPLALPRPADFGRDEIPSLWCRDKTSKQDLLVTFHFEHFSPIPITLSKWLEPRLSFYRLKRLRSACTPDMERQPWNFLTFHRRIHRSASKPSFLVTLVSNGLTLNFWGCNHHQPSTSSTPSTRLPNFTASSSICTASSRVGAITKKWGSPLDSVDDLPWEFQGLTVWRI